jgi:polyhydroxyalkanoate synthesis regulator phasin
MMSELLSSEPAPEQTTPEAVSTMETSTQESSVQQSLVDMVSPEYTDIIKTKGFDSINDVVKWGVNAEKYIGNSVRIPGEDADPQSKAEFLDKIKNVDGVIIKGSDDFYTKLGRPEQPTGYDFQEVVTQDLSKLDASIPQQVEAFKEVAHKLGLNQEQARALVDWRMQDLQTAYKQINDQQHNQLDNTINQLKEEWGTSYDENKKVADRVAANYAAKFGEETFDQIKSAAITNPVIMHMLVDLGSMYTQDVHVGSGEPTNSLQAVDDQIAALGRDEAFMKQLRNPNDPGHKTAMAKREDLYARRDRMRKQLGL